MNRDFLTNKCNFDNHLKINNQKKYPECTDFPDINNYGNSFTYKLLTSLRVIKRSTKVFHSICSKHFD